VHLSNFTGNIIRDLQIPAAPHGRAITSAQGTRCTALLSSAEDILGKWQNVTYWFLPQYFLSFDHVTHAGSDIYITLVRGDI
jgi:hypothetical protein